MEATQAVYPFKGRIPNCSGDLAKSNNVKTEWHAMKDDCWSIKALRGVNSLAASIALKKNLMVSVRVSLISSDGSDPTI
jgi:hypothetical protein